MELFKGQSLLEFTERFKTDLDCEEYLASLKVGRWILLSQMWSEKILSSQRFFTHLQYLFRYRKSYNWNFVSQAKIWTSQSILYVLRCQQLQKVYQLHKLLAVMILVDKQHIILCTRFVKL